MTKSGIALGALLLLSGCSTVIVTPDHAIEIIPPTAFHFAPGGAESDGINYQALIPTDDPAYKSLMARAECAPSLELALARVDAARAVAARAAAERKPEFGLGATAGGNRSNPNRFGNLPAGMAISSSQFEIGGQINARWDPDIFGALRNSAQAAQLRLDAAGHDAQAVRIAIMAEVAAAVIDWQNMQAQRAVVATNIAAAEDRSRLIASRVRAGLNPELDSLRADALVESLRSHLPAIHGEQAAIVARMVALTATSADDVLGELNQSLAQWTGPAAVTAAPSTVLAARPDIQAAAARLAASDAELAATAAKRFPRITVSSALGLLAFSLGGIFSADAIVAQLGGEIAGPLLDFGRIEAEIDQSRAESRIAFAELRRSTFIALGEVEDAYGRLSAADNEARITRLHADREADVARVAATRYRAGLENFIQVLDADRAAYAARQAAIAAQARASRVRLALWQRLGGPIS